MLAGTEFTGESDPDADTGDAPHSCSYAINQGKCWSGQSIGRHGATQAEMKPAHVMDGAPKWEQLLVGWLVISKECGQEGDNCQDSQRDPQRDQPTGDHEIGDT